MITWTTRFAPGVTGASRPPYGDWNLADHVGEAVDRVEANRQQLADVLALGRDRLRFMDQVHGTTVTVVRGSSLRAVPATDALVTTEADLALVVLVADCVPVLLTDRAGGVAAAVHAGRKGVAGDVVGAAVEVMRGLGAEDISASIGPSVCPGCYEVPQDLHDEVVGLVPATRARTRWGTASLDLRAGVRAQLAAAGVDRAQLDDACTVESPGLYSHRREGVTGRFGGVVVLRADGRG